MSSRALLIELYERAWISWTAFWSGAVSHAYSLSDLCMRCAALDECDPRPRGVGVGGICPPRGVRGRIVVVVVYLTLTDPLRIQPWSQDRRKFRAIDYIAARRPSGLL